MKADEAAALLTEGGFWEDKPNGNHHFYTNGRERIMLSFKGGRPNRDLPKAVAERVRKLASGRVDSISFGRNATHNKSATIELRPTPVSVDREQEITVSEASITPPQIEVSPNGDTGTILDALAGVELAAEVEYVEIVKWMKRIEAYKRLEKHGEALGLKIKPLPTILTTPTSPSTPTSTAPTPTTPSPTPTASLPPKSQTSPMAAPPPSPTSSASPSPTPTSSASPSVAGPLAKPRYVEKVISFIEKHDGLCTRTEMAQNFGDSFYRGDIGDAVAEMVRRGTLYIEGPNARHRSTVYGLVRP